MNIYVNGKEIEVMEGLSVAALVAEKELNPSAIVIEHNQNILPKDEWSQCVLSSEDKLEIVTFVGGG